MTIATAYKGLRAAVCTVAAAHPSKRIALVLPEATTRTMSLFLATLSHSLADGVHAVLVLDRAGWHLLPAEPDRLRSLCHQPRLQKVTS